MIRSRALWLLIGCVAAVIFITWAYLDSQESTPTDRHRERDRLKYIGMALQNYLNDSRHFPDLAIRDKEGKPLLSWRVAILPYLGKSDLYGQFHLNEPWNSEHNRGLIDQIPDEYHGDGTAAGQTRFLAPVGENLAFTSAGGGPRLKDITDGWETILVVRADADHAVVWTKPEDLAVDLENPKRGITDGNTRVMALFVGGYVPIFDCSVRSSLLRALFTRNGGEEIDSSEL